MALNYELNLAIDSESLKTLKAAGLKVTLAKPVGNGSPNTTWIVFDPFQGNKVTWKETFGMYASPQQTHQNGTVIDRISEVFPASDAAYYDFNSSANFHGPQTGAGSPPEGSFKVNNRMPHNQYPLLTFGLQQEAAINTRGIKPSPINAAIVPSQLSAEFTPLTKVVVWVQNQFTSGTVITRINGDATEVTFGNGVDTQNLVWNPNIGRFVPAAPSGEMLAIEDGGNCKFLHQAGVYTCPD